MDLLLHILFLGGVIFFLAESLPGLRVEGYGTAIIVAVVYSLINVTLGTVLKFLSIPFVIITVGFFLIVINSFLLLFLGGVIFFLAESLPGLRVEGYGTAIIVAVVYSLINVTLGTVLKFLSIPFVIITVGFFLIVINSFLLYLTDKILEDFEIEDMGTTFITAIIITLSDTLLSWIF